MNIIDLELDSYKNILIREINIIPSEIFCDIKNFIFSKSKQIRPSLIFLTAKALDIEITEDILKLAAAVEIIHNATLIHDDIIDNAEKRRGKTSLNKKIGNNLSVLSGDILLSIAMKMLSSLNDIRILDLFASALQKMCIGEINQNYSINKIPSPEEYIEKSKKKTAELFLASLEALCIMKNIKEKNKITDFALNFGIAFQIKDDVQNILKTDHLKPELSDIYNGIYTLPVIYLVQKHQNMNDFTKEEILKLISDDKDIIVKTIETIKKYTDSAIASLAFMKDNQYKNKIKELTQELQKVN